MSNFHKTVKPLLRDEHGEPYLIERLNTDDGKCVVTINGKYVATFENMALAEFFIKRLSDYRDGRK